MEFLSIPRGDPDLEIPLVLLHDFVDLTKHFILIGAKFRLITGLVFNRRHGAAKKQAA
jgi:hypothetical protein